MVAGLGSNGPRSIRCMPAPLCTSWLRKGLACTWPPSYPHSALTSRIGGTWAILPTPLHNPKPNGRSQELCHLVEALPAICAHSNRNFGVPSQVWQDANTAILGLTALWDSPALDATSCCSCSRHCLVRLGQDHTDVGRATSKQASSTQRGRCNPSYTLSLAEI